MTVELHLGDCLSVMAELPENSVDTILTDPPYGLSFMGKDWDTPRMLGQGNSKGNWKLRKGDPGYVSGNDAWYGHNDQSKFQEWNYRWAVEALRVAKPGAMLLAMGGTRTFHRLVVAIEDAGWEIRDSMAWLYGSGFPKSYDIEKGVNKYLKTGNASWNGTGDSSNGALGYSKLQHEQGYRPNDYSGKHQSQIDITEPAAQLWHGWGTALKPAMELICVAMKPIDGTYVNNALTWGVAGLWIDGGRVGTDTISQHGRNANSKPAQVPQNEYKPDNSWQGRFPANVIHDGSDEVTGLFPMTKSGDLTGQPRVENKIYGSAATTLGTPRFWNGDSGPAARFFYCAKASRSERNAGLEGMPEKQTVGGGGMNNTPDDVCGKYGSIKAPAQNHHPTVKPLALMRYLARLTKTPTGGVVLDPFMGSGTTGMAAVMEGRDFIGIELNTEYLEIAERRIQEAQKQPRLEGI